MVHICQEKYASTPKCLSVTQIKYKENQVKKKIWENLAKEKIAGRCFRRDKKIIVGYKRQYKSQTM